MTTYSDLELWALVSAVYYDNNEFVTYPTGETRGQVREALTGLQAELLHTEAIESIEDSGQPANVFITPRDILALTNYTELGTVRRRLDKLVDDGLLETHGEFESTPEGEHRRYLPATLEHENLVRTLHERDGRSIPDALQPETRSHVAPSEFSHDDGTVFELEREQTIHIDVGKPASDQSIQATVADQLAANGLSADLNNFVYTLRNRANLIDRANSESNGRDER